jgi:hypothetical protein
MSKSRKRVNAAMRTSGRWFEPYGAKTDGVAKTQASNSEDRVKAYWHSSQFRRDRVTLGL